MNRTTCRFLWRNFVAERASYRLSGRSFLSWSIAPCHRRRRHPDAELLRLYAVEKDEVAFELLVRRHADTVWTACRRILRNDADAEDAFQATFLALAKKAGTVRESQHAGRVALSALR